jgi:hypothetical protein
MPEPDQVRAVDVDERGHVPAHSLKCLPAFERADGRGVTAAQVDALDEERGREVAGTRIAQSRYCRRSVGPGSLPMW